ncbi:MAG: PilT/PilU family type 4a pilus ATPase [Planctomycetes bacterium]|nr:PilT/PilU family type 4a pilus ATPase [Planctomycetota bacterium]
MEFHELLRRMVTENASDLFIKVGCPPSLRVDGAVKFLDCEEISPRKSQEFLEIIQDSRPEALPQKLDVDTSYDLPGIGRFRVNIFHQRGQLGFVFRHVSQNVSGFDELGLPEETLTRLAMQKRGLVLVTGNTGSGKSTTLASMVHHINETVNRHIVTIEDPIEFTFRDRKSIIDQREVGIDTDSFPTALRHSLRQSPDVILIGEMRDRETMEAAIAAAETGHLVLSTLHTVNAVQTVERIIHFFPPHQHDLIRLQLSLVLSGVVCQRLVPSLDGQGRIPALEMMINSPTIRELLREGKTHELHSAVRDGEHFGSRTFNQSLRDLYRADRITLDDALAFSDFPEELQLELRGVVKGNAMGDFDFDY